jgi:carboxymethylenebutenolidase
MSSILVLHPWWGLNADIRAVCDRLVAEGYVVQSPDLYDGKVATEIPEAERLMKAVDQDAAKKKIDAAADELRERGSRLAILGWSMGGNFGWDLIVRRPGEVSAIVAYYGIGEVDESKPVPPVLNHIGELDEDVPYLREIEEVLKGAGKDVTTHVYPGAKHWFDEPSRPEYDAAASALAWGRTLSFLRKHLG